MVASFRKSVRHGRHVPLSEKKPDACCTDAVPHQDGLPDLPEAVSQSPVLLHDSPTAYPGDAFSSRGDSYARRGRVPAAERQNGTGQHGFRRAVSVSQKRSGAHEKHGYKTDEKQAPPGEPAGQSARLPLADKKYAERRDASPALLSGRKGVRHTPAAREKRVHAGLAPKLPLGAESDQWARMAQRRREQQVLRQQLRDEGNAQAPAASSAIPAPEVRQETAGAGNSRNWRAGGREEVAAWQRFPSSGHAPNTTAPATDQRLNKALAEAGYCSRRRADILVFTGHVTVNGEREVQPSRRVGPEDHIAVDGQPIRRGQAKCYLLLHKPVQVVCTVSDPQGRPTVLDCLPPEYRDVRLFPVGRLDYFSEGLLLLTNDGALSQRLMHPRDHLPKVYDVLVRDVVREKALQAMRDGMTLAEGEHLQPVDVTARATATGKTRLRMVLRQGVNRQIRRMCRDLGLTILRLRRVSLGPLQLGDLPAGQCRALTANEVDALRRAAGLA